MNNLRENLLVYIGYCLKESGYYFSYEKCGQVFTQFGIKHEITTLRKEFSLLKKEKLVEFKLRYRKPYPVLTQKGRLLARTKLPFRHFESWDGKWRVVVFDIPQKYSADRFILRKELEKLGFGRLKKSVYVSPYPLLAVINRLSSDWGIRQHLNLLEVSRLYEEKRAFECWNLEEINKKYAEFIKKTAKAKRTSFWPLKARILEKEFVEIYINDPHLPEELRPKDWTGREAYKLFKEISNSY